MKKITPKKYLSPYLEPLNIYGKTWCKIEKNKIYNENINAQIKRQKLRENKINIRKKQKVKLCYIIYILFIIIFCIGKFNS